MIRCIFPSIAESKNSRNKKAAEVQQKQELPLKDYEEDIAVNTVETTSSRFFKSDGTLTKNPIYSVPHFGKTFPDQNDVQLLSAKSMV